MATRWIVCLVVLMSYAGASHVARAQKDPFADNAATVDGAAPAADPNKQPPAQAAAPVAAPSADTAPASAPGCGEFLTEEKCRGTNTPLFVKAAGYVLLTVLLMTFLRVWWNRRGTATPETRLFVPLTMAAVGAGALVAFDPMREKILTCCLLDPTMVQHIFLRDSVAGRAVVLGVLPAAALFFIIAFVEKQLKR